ncbi:MAG: ABC transporter permease [Anaerolineales bacterium]|nr:MAG: ABC transporter permease [Anaerolineales bacterium]
MTAFINHTLIEFRSSIRSKQLLFLNYAFPLGFYVMMGLVMTQINPLFTETMVPAMVLFSLMAAILLGMPDPLVNARESGIFRSYKIMGIPARNILIVPALNTVMHVIIVCIIILITGPLFFNAPGPDNLLAFLIVTLASMIAHTGVGALISVISSSSRATVLWSQLIFLPSMLLSGLMMPYEMLPASAQTFARLFPATYSMIGYKELAYTGGGGAIAVWSLVILVTGGLLAFGLAIALFSWDSYNTSQRRHQALGLLALLPYILGAVFLR